MVSPPAIQAQREIIQRKIVLLEKNNEMTRTFLDAIQDQYDKKPRKSYCRIGEIEYLLQDDLCQVYDMIETLERQLYKCW